LAIGGKSDYILFQNFCLVCWICLCLPDFSTAAECCNAHRPAVRYE